jgi:putative N6-adenine-specific DNA methylase
MKLRHWETWSLYVISAMSEVERHFGRKADRRRKLYNGRIECTYYQFQGPRPPRPKQDDATASE